LRSIESEKIAAVKSQTSPQKQVAKMPVDAGQSSKSKKSSVEDKVSAPVKDMELYKWIRAQYLESAFTKQGFIGWANFQKVLQNQMPLDHSRVQNALQQCVQWIRTFQSFLIIASLRSLDHPHGLKSPQRVEQERSAVRKQQAGLNKPAQFRMPDNQCQAAPSIELKFKSPVTQLADRSHQLIPLPFRPKAPVLLQVLHQSPWIKYRITWRELVSTTRCAVMTRFCDEC
jgi:hypothetical protein